MTPESSHREISHLQQRVAQLEAVLVERDRVDLELKELKHKLSFMVQRAPIGMVEYNTDLQVVGWNPAAEEIFGYTQAEVLGCCITDLLVADSLQTEVNQRLTNLLRQQNSCRHINENLTKDRKTIVCEWYNLTLTSSDGSVVGILSMVLDITQRQQTETALWQSNQRVTAILSSISDAFFCLDTEGHFTYLNHQVEPVLRRSASELLGKTIWEEFPEALDSAFYHKCQRAMQKLAPVTFEEYYPTLQSWFEVQIYPFEAGVSVYFRDISQRKHQEEALEQAIERFNLVGLATNEGVWDVKLANGSLTDPNSTFWYSQRFREMLGFTNEQDLPNTLESWSDRIHPEDYDWATAAFDQHLYDRTGQTSHDCEYRMVTKQGEVIWIRDVCTTLRDAEGVPVRTSGAIRDITEQRQAREELRHSRQLLQSIIDNNNSCIFVKEYAQTDGTYLLVNRNFAKLFNIDQLTVHGKTDYDFFPPEIADDLRRIDQQVMVSGKLLQREEEIPQPDGIHTYIAVKFPLLSEAGKPYAVCGIATDISDRKRAERALQIANEELEHRVHQRTAELQQTVALLKEEVCDRQQAETALLENEQQLRQKADDLEQALCELRRTQSQLVQSEKMSSLGQLVAGVAHEINNPVNFIYGNLTHANTYIQDLLRLLNLYQTYYPEPGFEIETLSEAIDLPFLIADLPRLLSSMKVGADRIQQIVASLRNFSRMDEAEMKAVNIHEGIDSTLMILQNRLRAKPGCPNVEVIKDYGDLPRIECYAGQLNQVFMNILSNAIDALEEKIRAEQNVNEFACVYPRQSSLIDTNYCLIPTIHISTEMINQNWIRIRLADNGPGIPDAIQKRMFDPFFTTKPVGKGTGLGMSISYQIVTDRHGGSLECHSIAGQGAEFVIEIPTQQRKRRQAR